MLLQVDDDVDVLHQLLQVLGSSGSAQFNNYEYVLCVQEVFSNMKWVKTYWTYTTVYIPHYLKQTNTGSRKKFLNQWSHH